MLVVFIFATLFKIMFHCFDSFQALLSVDALQLDSPLPVVSTNYFCLVDSFKNSFGVLHVYGASLVEQTSHAKAPLL